MKGALIALILVIVVLTAVSGVILRDYNQLSTEKHDIEARWTELDKDMRNRANRIANLTEPVKGYGGKEESLLRDVALARAALLSAQTKREEMEDNNRLSSALARLFTSQNRVGGLASNQNLQDALADVEQNIANDRSDYNEAIKKYNTDLLLFPQNVTAALFHFRRDDAYFLTPGEDSKTPQS